MDRRKNPNHEISNEDNASRSEEGEKDMSKSSQNLSDRLFVTMSCGDDHVYFGELEGKQKIVLNLTPEETTVLLHFLESYIRE